MTPTEQAKTRNLVVRAALAIWAERENDFDERVRRSSPDHLDMETGAFERVRRQALASVSAWKKISDAEIDAAIEAAGIPWGFGHTEGRRFISALVDAAFSEEGE